MKRTRQQKNAFRHGLASRGALCACTLLLATGAAAQETDLSDLDNEVFTLGVFTGVMNIGDFGSEWVLGVSASFQASENFFLQYNYLETDADVSSFEKSQGRYFSGSDRSFVHYDLLVGYKLFQAEVYPTRGSANLSSLYLVGGVGDTRFGDEESFTFTYGLGYEVAMTRRVILNVDYRNYLYETSLIRGEEETTQNTQFSVGVSYLF
ncbi:outer membrane beta-barrel domain-containing protein [Gilvimarinus sp. F26214L]|uniref:outer membrane beta-barrel domain-containing protein n=1 Tax=Gilvimarinus sp. DZF01 TaxID=3461371 RepID=UPI004045B15E